MLTPAGFVDLIDKEYFYYIKDYRENISAVVDDAGKCRQVNHYYPYGSLMGESWTDIDNDYRWEGKRLNSFAGLNHYDFETRNYDPVVPGFTSLDPLAEIDASNSPYTYCAANPIRNIDPSGMDWITAKYGSDYYYFFDPRIKSQRDINKFYPDNTNIEYLGKTIGITITTEKGNKTQLSLYSNGNFSINFLRQHKEYNNGLHVGGTNYTNIETIASNWYGSYLGPNNPRLEGGGYSYAVPPCNNLDWDALRHDKGYDKKNAVSYLGTLYPSVQREDFLLALRAFLHQDASSPKNLFWANSASILFGTLSTIKLPFICVYQLGECIYHSISNGE